MTLLTRSYDFEKRGYKDGTRTGRTGGEFTSRHHLTAVIRFTGLRTPNGVTSSMYHISWARLVSIKSQMPSYSLYTHVQYIWYINSTLVLQLCFFKESGDLVLVALAGSACIVSGGHHESQPER